MVTSPLAARSHISAICDFHFCKSSMSSLPRPVFDYPGDIDMGAIYHLSPRLELVPVSSNKILAILIQSDTTATAWIASGPGTQSCFASCSTTKCDPSDNISGDCETAI